MILLSNYSIGMKNEKDTMNHIQIVNKYKGKNITWKYEAEENMK